MAEIFQPTWANLAELSLQTATKTAPIFNLPDGRFITTINKRTDVQGESIIGRAGCIATMNTEVDRDKQFEWTHAHLFEGTGKPLGADYGSQNLTKQDIYSKVDTLPISRIYGNEIGEGTWGMPYGADQKRWFYERLQQNFQQANKPYPYLNIGTYGGFEYYNGDYWLYKTNGSHILPNSESAPFKNFMRTVAGARSSCAYFSLFESLGVGACVKNYADQPDYMTDFSRKLHAAETMGTGMGKVGGIGPGLLTYLDWPNIEALGETGPGSLHNGTYYTRTKPNGQVVTHEAHPVVDRDYLEACNYIIGMCASNGITPFNDRIKYSPDPNSDDYPMEPVGLMDVAFYAAYRYAQNNRTEGQPWKYARWRFAGSEQWIEPTTDGTDILEAASAFDGPYGGLGSRRGRPIFKYRVKNNALDWWGFDFSRGKFLAAETIIVEPVPGKQFSVDLRGGKLRQFRETI